MHVDQREIVRKAELAGLLERICQALELTNTQYELARTRYEGVGVWLAEARSELLSAVSIYPQGSVSLGTTVRPIARKEHDVDLVCHIPSLEATVSPATVKRIVGERLRENGHYAPILEEMPRCWRLSYANEFHLDITPSIPNPECNAGGELVPDKTLREWKASNPKGYRSLFQRRACLQPRVRLLQAAAADGMGDVEPYPARMTLKGVLRRSVQLAKRHRDVYFANFDPSLAPLSIIVTTLASQSYEYCVRTFEYDSEFDLLCDVVRYMPEFVETGVIAGRRQWFIWNETTNGENFAEKWNAEPSRAEAFFEWQTLAAKDLTKLADLSGLDRLGKSLSESFGAEPVTRSLSALSEAISSARRAGRLSVAPGIGLSIGTGLGSSVPANTFFGAE